VPAFHIAPIIAVWAVESINNPGWVGFWAFSGNLPGDVISRDWNDKNDNPRKALARMNAVWRTYIGHLQKGNNPPNVKLGNNENQRIEMSGILQENVSMFDSIIDDDSIWDEDCEK